MLQLACLNQPQRICMPRMHMCGMQPNAYMPGLCGAQAELGGAWVLYLLDGPDEGRPVAVVLPAGAGVEGSQPLPRLQGVGRADSTLTAKNPANFCKRLWCKDGPSQRASEGSEGMPRHRQRCHAPRPLTADHGPRTDACARCAAGVPGNRSLPIQTGHSASRHLLLLANGPRIE